MSVRPTLVIPDSRDGKERRGSAVSDSGEEERRRPSKWRRSLSYTAQAL